MRLLLLSILLVSPSQGTVLTPRAVHCLDLFTQYVHGFRSDATYADLQKCIVEFPKEVRASITYGTPELNKQLEECVQLFIKSATGGSVPWECVYHVLVLLQGNR